MTPKLRCALYTRKSSEEGLDQSFNSLHAQREACEAYVKSQAGEGWRALPADYDDGGFSGGSMERPALRRLLADIAAGRIDIVVVYKIDRLTRSLTDFAKMVEVFDRQKVSFVSVTQAFNTTSSMGRLTLNVLLSFAQFEREVTGERIRDKIAASKARGMWMGGTVPLGYDVPNDDSTRALIVNEAEAATVRQIFETYLEFGSVHALRDRLEALGIRSKAHITAKGRAVGGLPFARGALFHLLRNRLYVGQIVHKTLVHPGAHAGIVPQDLFDAVQARLDAGARRHAERPLRVAEAVLKGRLFDADGEPMSPTFSHGARGQVYRYYVSAPLQQGKRRAAADPVVRRMPGPALEAALRERLERLLPAQPGDMLDQVMRVEVHADSTQLLLPARLLNSLRARLRDGEAASIDAQDRSMVRLHLPLRARVRGGRVWITGGDAHRTQADPALLKALRAAHTLLDRGADGLPTLRAAPQRYYDRKLIRLAFLAPDIQQAILDGRQPLGLSVDRLIAEVPALLWHDQIAAFEGR